MGQDLMASFHYGANCTFLQYKRRHYKLPKLSEVKNYIETNHHLPEIPSAEEMQKEGMNVGELNTKLLQKIEELTLYLIDQQKEIEQLKQQVSTQIKSQK